MTFGTSLPCTCAASTEAASRHSDTTRHIIRHDIGRFYEHTLRALEPPGSLIVFSLACHKYQGILLFRPRSFHTGVPAGALSGQPGLEKYKAELCIPGIRQSMYFE